MTATSLNLNIHTELGPGKGVTSACLMNIHKKLPKGLGRTANEFHGASGKDTPPEVKNNEDDSQGPGLLSG